MSGAAADGRRPERTGRRQAMPHRLFRGLSRTLCLIFVRLFFRLEYKGLEHVPLSGPAILVANHTSLFDMLVIHTRIAPWIHWVAKKELFRHRLTAAVFSRLGCIPVDRDKTDLTAARGIIGALRRQQIVGVFPQGTRVKPDRIDQVKPRSGAVHFACKTGAPLLPVAIEGRFRLFHRVRIVFGELIYLQKADNECDPPIDFDRLSLEMMQRIYALIGRTYQLDPRILERRDAG